ncbi:MAG: N-acetylmuramic acid 6-phosphate etherase [Candidatus Hydrogenedentes bacterium]|nr:N-acetylmuramic acid 6-phosphate etherase [Candidatus Hydrogenedentota bacterium]
MALYLALEGGGTATRAALYDGNRALLAEADGPASNPVDGGVAACAQILVSLGRELLVNRDEPLSTVTAGISGAANPMFRDAIAQRVSDALRAERTLVTDDLRPLLMANAPAAPAILAIAGTGSSVLAKSETGETIIIGGRGPLFGDEGSAYQIAVSALRAAARSVDGTGPATRLTDALSEALGAASFAELAVRARAASKRQIANLAVVVSRLAEAGDTVARDCVVTQANRLAVQVAAAQARLSLPDDTAVYLNGGLFEHCPLFRLSFAESLAKSEAGLRTAFPALRGPRAVVELSWLPLPLPNVSVVDYGAARVNALPPTEQSALMECPLDRLSPREIVERMNSEDARLGLAVAADAHNIATVISLAAEAIRSGGRIIYVGAGTSGRLGVLDASECPPTFGVAPNQVVGIIAGGARALRESVEGAEDDTAQAAADLAALAPEVSSADVVIGVAASGATPYVHAALETARAVGAHTALVSCNPVSCSAAEFVIVAETGPEVLAGSTRLKAGTATKMILNMISTGAMALAGYVYEGQMIGMRPINAKLRRRAVRIIGGLTGVSEPRAAELLDATGGSIQEAVIMARLSLDAAAARERMRSAGTLRRALEGTDA